MTKAKAEMHIYIMKTSYPKTDMKLGTTGIHIRKADYEP